MKTSGKWNGKSLYQLGLKRQRIKGIQLALSELSQIKMEAERAFMTELGQILDRNPDSLQQGPWPCDGSPTQQCVYDMSSELQDDECLFCHEPLERK